MKHDDTTARFFWVILPTGTMASNLKKRLGYYANYNDEGSWDDTDTPFPNILFVAESGLVEASLRRLINRELYHSDTDINYYTTTLKAILAMTSTSQRIWTNAADTDELISLQEIQTQ